MRKFVYPPVVGLLVAFAVLLQSPAASAAAEPVTQEARSALKRLERMSGAPVEMRWNADTGTPALVAGELSGPSDHSPAWIAYAYFERTKRLYGIRSPRQDLVVTGFRMDEGISRIRLERLVYRTPVWGDSVLLEIGPTGVLRRAEGVIHPGLEKKLLYRPQHPAIDATQAAKQAAASVGADRADVGEPKLYYLPDRPGTPLVYAVPYGERPDGGPEGHILVHAVTGRAIRTVPSTSDT
ncbi:hypothetical protein [Cohnella nanjingensis]|uniref:PepSY domain-containing protein n=1 Tax=Cohnella nanjingensis TaxID=1387779 RepID=A0A7X0RPY7_9BACL|nr:hypothetical protein [Cohnella nanjingensis]MBB6671534.1 hypothetical protein [Cohnella nanjingensis]